MTLKLNFKVKSYDSYETFVFVVAVLQQKNT